MCAQGHKQSRSQSCFLVAMGNMLGSILFLNWTVTKEYKNLLGADSYLCIPAFPIPLFRGWGAPLSMNLPSSSGEMKGPEVGSPLG